MGTLTTLLETMFHKTHYHQNQYTMAHLQNPYVETYAYGNPNKNPSNTIYDEHAVRVLAEQASVLLVDGVLLPYHPDENFRGTKFSQCNVPILMSWGKYDKMMPEGQVYRFNRKGRKTLYYLS